MVIGNVTPLQLELQIRGNHSENSPHAEQIQQKGFTITELLVLIGCLGVLAATVLPVLAASQANTQSVVCLNNLQRLGVAVHMYAADHNDEMVYPNWGTVNRWQGWLYTSPGAGNLAALNQALTLPAGQKGPLGNSQACPPINLTAPNVQKYIYKANALSPYLPNSIVYWCPAQNAASALSPWFQKFFLSSPGSTSVSGNDIYSTYIMNGAIVNFPDASVNAGSLNQYKLSNVHFRPNDVLMWEPGDTVLAYNDGSSRASEGDGGEPGQTHGTGCPLLRIDGGGEMQDYRFMITQMAGFPTSSTGITTTTPFNNEFYYAPGFIDGGFADANGAAPTQ